MNVCMWGFKYLVLKIDHLIICWHTFTNYSNKNFMTKQSSNISSPYSGNIDEVKILNKKKEAQITDMEDDDANITKNELDLLDKAGSENGKNDIDEAASQLDSTDDDGVALNERTDLTGSELDVPGADLDNEDELIGEEDEENNSYSESDQDDK